MYTYSVIAIYVYSKSIIYQQNSLIQKNWVIFLKKSLKHLTVKLSNK